MMRILFALIVALAALWSGYWFVGRAGVNEAYENWFQARRAEGWIAQAARIETIGFPKRFDTTFTEIVLADPETGLAWEAPFLQLFARSYRPNHVIAAWPRTQRLATADEQYQIESENMVASLRTAVDIRLPVERIILTAENLAITPRSSGRPLRVEALRLAAERAAAHPATYRLGLAAEGLSPPLDWRVRLDPGGTLPARFETLRADATLRFDKPWDRSAIEAAWPQPQHLEIRRAELRWGRLELLATGAIEIDASGRPEGTITIRARNWRDILAMAVASGMLDRSHAATLEQGLSQLARLGGNPETLAIPLRLGEGELWIGAASLGPAPVLRTR